MFAAQSEHGCTADQETRRLGGAGRQGNGALAAALGLRRNCKAIGL